MGDALFFPGHEASSSNHSHKVKTWRDWARKERNNTLEQKSKSRIVYF